MKNWQRLFDRRIRSAWAVLLVCLSLTLSAWYGLRAQATKSATQQFELHAHEVIGSIEERLRQHEQILLGGAGLFDASESVKRAEWRAYIERLDLGQNYPGIQGVGFTQAIRPAELKAHTAAIRAEGFPDYTVRPPGERPLYTSIVFLEPFAGRNLAAFGYDMMSEAVRAKAMRMAAESGKTAISGKVKLVQETYGKEQAGFLMYLPVYRKHQPLATPEQRWAALQGFVYSPYRIEDLMEGMLGNRMLKLRFVIFDGEEEAEGARMYASAEDRPGRAHTAPPQMSDLRTIQAYGHTWTVRLHSSPAFEAEFRSPLNAVILALGGGISVLLFTLVSFLIFRRERAEELARQMTEEIRLNEARLRQTKHLLDSIIENIPTMVFLKRADDLRFELFNRAGEKLLGYARSDLLGKNDYDFFPKEQADFFTAADRRVLASDRVLEIPEEPIKTASGEMRYFQTWKIALRGEGGEPTHLLGISIDITERKNAAESIARISNLNRAIVDGAEHLIITTDENGVIQSFNRAAEIHLGYHAEELAGKSSPAVFHDPDEVAHRARELTAAGIPVEPGFEVFVARARRLFGGETHEWTYIRKDGSRFPVLLTITALRDGHGEINAFLGIATDITERKRAEEELRKLSRAIEQSPVSVVITDAKGKIEYVNAKFSEVTGYAIQEVIGQNPRIVQSGLTPVEVYRSMWRTILGGGQWHGKLQNRKKSGELFWEEIRISGLRDNNGEITNFIAVKEDITERMKVERMKSEFISTVSHELRTPLTSIRGSLALIAGGVVGELPAAAKPLVDIAHKNSERLILLVNDILDIEKIESGKMEFTFAPVKLMPLLNQAIESNRAYAEQYKVSYELENELANESSSDLSEAIVKVDANRLMQVLANLLSNAAKFSHSGGRVLIEAKRIGHNIRVAVKDNGSGIPDEFKGRIFQKFAQADSSDTRKKGGTGLGLAITKSIVEQMGGSIGFDSLPNVQTVFYIEFPEWTDERGNSKQPISLHDPVEERAGNMRSRVLHIESDPDIFHVVQGVVGEVVDMDQAVSLAETREALARHRYDLAILDLDFLDGVAKELFQLLKAALPPVPVLVFSAHDIGQEYATEADAVLVKSRTDNAQLLATIKRLIGVE